MNKAQSTFRAHPLHGIPTGKDAPKMVNVYVEIVPTDTVKYELDKESGLLKVDRPQKYSNWCPALYGFVPRTHCGDSVAEFAMMKSGKKEVQGDGDPLDICVISEKAITHGDILIEAIPIGGFRAIDDNEADDKIIAVLAGDLIYGEIKDIQECPAMLIDRLRHYFLTYKLPPGSNKNKIEIVSVYGRDEAHEVIKRAQKDYADLG